MQKAGHDDKIALLIMPEIGPETGHGIYIPSKDGIF